MLTVAIILLFVVTSVVPTKGDLAVLNGMKKENSRSSPPVEEWNRTYSNPSGSTLGNCVQITPDGGYIVTGYVGYGYWYDVYVLKVDNQGHEEWNCTFGNQSVARYDIGNWVEVTNDTGYIITGDNCRIYSNGVASQTSRTGDINPGNDMVGAPGKGKEGQQFYAFDNMYPVQSVWFDPADPGTLHDIAYSTANSYISAGTWADSVWYVSEYYGGLYTVDPTTGDMTLIGSSIQLNGLGYVDATGTMYGCDSTNLYKVDMSTGATTLVGPMNNAGMMIDMATDSYGNAYGVDVIDNNLYSIDLSTGAATVIGPIGISCYYGGMGYDKDNDVLYLAAYTGEGQLYTVDVTTGHATLVGPFQDGDEVEGLAIPYDGVWYHYDKKVWLIKIDTSGNEEWNKTFSFGQGLGQAGGSCVKQTKDGGYIITGSNAGRLLLLKTDMFGNELWNKTYYGNYTGGSSLALTADGGYIITGQNYYRLLLMKTDKSGTVEWEREFFTNAWPGNSGSRVQQTTDGGYIVGGVTFTDGASNNDLLLMKTDENGVEQWNRTFGGSEGDWGGTVVQTVDGDYVLGGTQIGLEHVWPDRFWIIRTHPDGSVVWDNFYLPSLSARCFCLQQTRDNGFIAAGALDMNFAPKCVILKIAGDNNPPHPPTITGPTSGKVGGWYNYTFNATDPDNDNVSYYVDWGDSSSGWAGPFASGAEVTFQHAWNRTDQYSIFAKVKDSFGHESNWSKPFTVSILQRAFLLGLIHDVYPSGEYITFGPTRVLALWLSPFYVAKYSFGLMMISKNTAGFVGKSFIIGMFDAAVMTNRSTSMSEYLRHLYPFRPRFER
jgi:hypothetical protein